MEVFGSLPPEAGGMDLFHLMSVWGSGGEERITGWRCLNWQEGSKRKDTMQHFSLSIESRAQIILGGLFEFNYLWWLKVSPPSRLRSVQSPFTKKDILPFSQSTLHPDSAEGRLHLSLKSRANWQIGGLQSEKM